MTIRSTITTKEITMKNLKEITVIPRRSYVREGVDYDIKSGEDTLATYTTPSIANSIIERIKEALKNKQNVFNLPYEGPIAIAFN